MEVLLISNTVVFGLLSLIWSKDNWLNLLIKATLITLTVCTGITAYHVSEANRIERAK